VEWNAVPAWRIFVGWRHNSQPDTRLTLFRHIWIVRICSSALLVGAVLWLIVPQAFAASTSSDTGGWVQHFMDGSTSREPVQDGGMQSTSDLSNLLVQPVLVAGSAPGLSSLRVSVLDSILQDRLALARTTPGRRVDAVGTLPFPVFLLTLQPKGP